MAASDTAKTTFGGLQSAASIYQGLTGGGAAGKANAALNAEKLASKTGVFGANTGALNSAAGYGSNALGIYSGLQQGGVQGYSGAAVNAAQLGSRVGAFGGASGAIGTAAGYAAAPLALYSAIKGYQSGDTGGDALRGAEAGAAIGSVVPVVGTLLGGLIGGGIGAISSAFGNGKVDPENANFEAYTQAYNKGQATGANVQNPYTALAGMFDLRSNQIKGSIPMYTQYGRMGEQKFTTDMTGQINKALANGTVSPTDSAQTVYQKAVQPWIDSMGTWKDSNKPAMQSLLTQMTGQYMDGSAQSSWKDVSGKSTFASLPQYGQGVTLPDGRPAQTQNAMQGLAPQANAQQQSPFPQFAGQGGVGQFAGQGGMSSPSSGLSPNQASNGSPSNSSNILGGLGAGLAGAGVLGSAFGGNSQSQGSPSMPDQTNGQSGYGGLLNGLIGAGGTLLSQYQNSSAANNAAGMSQLQGAGVYTPGGSINATTGPGGVNYNLSSPLQGQFNQFANLAGQYGQNALQGASANNPLAALPPQVQQAYANAQNTLSQPNLQGAAGNNYLGAGNSVLNQFQNFNPQAFAQQQYQNLSALAAPGQTDQTQAMLNYEQATGRGGVTQNGQLGDLGGLNLSQQLADQNRQLQAQQLATQQQNSLGSLASGLSGTGSNLIGAGNNQALNSFGLANQALQAGQGVNTSNLNNSLAATGGSTGINQQLLQLLQATIGGQSAQAQAGANAGGLLAKAGNQNASSTGNLFGGLAQSGIGNSIANLFSGSGSSSNQPSNFGISNNGGYGSQFSNVPSYSTPSYSSNDPQVSGDTTYWG